MNEKLLFNFVSNHNKGHNTNLRELLSTWSFDGLVVNVSLVWPKFCPLCPVNTFIYFKPIIFCQTKVIQFPVVPTDGASLQQGDPPFLHLSSSSTPAAQTSAGGFVMVTWRCCGYITTNVWACRPAQSCWLSLHPKHWEKECACCSVSTCLQPLTRADLNDTVTNWVDETWSFIGTDATFLRGIMRNVELWFYIQLITNKVKNNFFFF